jgi:methyl-accepting chemotaxis protein
MKIFKPGLIVKFTISVFATLILSVIALSYFNVQIERLRAEAEIKDKGQALAHGLAYNSEYGILSNNTENLARLVEGAMREDVVYVQIVDNQGKVLAAARTKAEANILTNAKTVNFEVPVISLGIKRPAEEIGLEPFATAKAAPQEARKIGAIKLQISLIRVNTIIGQLLGLIWGTALAVMLVGVLILTLLVRLFLIHPLKQFVAGTKKIAQGDLVHRVKIESRDEIGELAGSFNEMTNELDQAREQLMGYTKELEYKVTERTRALEKTVGELKQTTFELATAKTGLEQKVAERTDELEKARLSLEDKVKERTKDLEAAKSDLENKVAELKEFHDLTVGRELKMIDLEKENDALFRELGRPAKYKYPPGGEL